MYTGHYTIMHLTMSNPTLPIPDKGVNLLPKVTFHISGDFVKFYNKWFTQTILVNMKINNLVHLER